MSKLVELKNISKRFPGVQALKQVNFELEKGEVHILLGENGAGKSTLVKILAGIIVPDQGEIYLEEKRIQPKSLLQAQKLGISIVLQEFNLIPDLSIAENLLLINRPEGKLFQLISRRTLEKEAENLFARLGIYLSPSRLIRQLSVAEKQLVEIAKALSFQARVLILDEPTATLAEEEVARLFKIIRLLKKQGLGIIYISHRLKEIFQIGDRVSVLRDGEKEGTYILSEVDEARLIKLMVGRELKEYYPKRKIEPGETILEVKNLSSRIAGLKKINFQLRRGEILGLAGLVGAGRTELAKTLFGLYPYEEGEIIYLGNQVKFKSPSSAISSGICYLSEDRKEEGLFPDKTARFNLTISFLQSLSFLGWLKEKQEKSKVRELFSELRILPPNPERPAQTFSGGNQQKIILARWWATQPRVLILDEPTRGIDVGAKVEIHNLIGDFLARGGAVIIISSELPELIGVCDRILVLSQGQIRGELKREEFSQEKILALATG